MRSRTITVTVFVLVILGGAGYWLWNRYEAPKGQLPATTAVTRGDIQETVLATGIVKPVHLVAVGAQASGRITNVAVTLGETVSQGDLIAEIDSGTQENALRTAQAALDNARAQLQEKQATLTLSEQKLERYTELFNKNTGTRADYESALAEVKVTTAQIAAIRAAIIEAEVAVDNAKVNLGYTRITAPSDGTVLAIVSQEGQTVNAAQSAPTIVVLGQLDRMTVRTEISEADITKVSPGMPVTFTVFGDPDTVYRSTLESIEPAPESVKNDSSFTASSSTSSSSSEAIYYNGVFTVPNEDGKLRTYMTAEVEIVLGTASNVLTIPLSVLTTPDGDGRYTVQVMDDAGNIKPVKIETGLDNRVRTEVKSGLSEDDRIVTGGDPANGDPDGLRHPPAMGL